MNGSLKLMTILIAASGIACVLADGGRCKPIVLENGRPRLQRGGRLVRFRCSKGYEFVGRRYMNCFQGQWDFQRDKSINYPMCVKPGCRASAYVNGHFLETYKGAVVSVVCSLGYTLHGSSTVYCNGSEWNRSFPECRAESQSPSKKCDFEDDLCGWSQDPYGDWIWKEGWSRSEPPFEEGNLGRYMILGDSSSRVANATERLFSPVFPAEYSNKSCFAFWYRMHGPSSGHIKVFVKKEGFDLSILIPNFWVVGDQGPSWKEGYFVIDRSDVPFQIIIEGMSLPGGESETAFDDVEIATGEGCDALRELLKTTTPSPTSTSVSADDSDDDESLSCKNRCGEDAVVPNTDLTAKDLQETAKCDCHEACERKLSCCSDYYQYCPTTTEVPPSSTTTEATETPQPTTTTTTTTTTAKAMPTQRAANDSRWSYYAGIRGSHLNKFRPIMETTTEPRRTDHLKLLGGDPEESGGIPSGAIEAAAAVAVVVVCATIAAVLIRRRRRRKTEKESMVEDSDSFSLRMNPIYESLPSQSSLICIRSDGLAKTFGTDLLPSSAGVGPFSEMTTEI